MTARCRPGDRAFITKAENQREFDDLGKIVKVIAPGNDFTFIGDSRLHWVCHSESGPLWAQCVHGDQSWVLLTELQVADACLTPIRGGLDGAAAVDKSVPVEVTV